MSNMVDGFENDVLDGISGVTALFSAGMALALFTADPTDVGLVTNELSGNGYERKLLSGLFSSATGTDGSVSNTSQIDFATATANWTEVTHVGFMKSDVETADDMIVWLPLASAITILDTQVFSFSIGNLTVTAS